MKFEIISQYVDAGLQLPERKTAYSAGYDFQVAKDTIVPSYLETYNQLRGAWVSSEFYNDRYLDLEKISILTK